MYPDRSCCKTTLQTGCRHVNCGLPNPACTATSRNSAGTCSSHCGAQTFPGLQEKVFYAEDQRAPPLHWKNRRTESISEDKLSATNWLCIFITPGITARRPLFSSFRFTHLHRSTFYIFFRCRTGRDHCGPPCLWQFSVQFCSLYRFRRRL